MPVVSTPNVTGCVSEQMEYLDPARLEVVRRDRPLNGAPEDAVASDAVLGDGIGCDGGALDRRDRTRLLLSHSEELGLWRRKTQS